MSDFYKNDLSESLKAKIDKDYLFSMHKLAFEQSLSVSSNDILELDSIAYIDNTERASALKDFFLKINRRDK